MNIQIATGDITDLGGDIIIVPCDSELTSKNLQDSSIKELTIYKYSK